MIISPRQRPLSPLAKILRWAGVSRIRRTESRFLTERDFRFEIEKERARLERRLVTGSFALIVISEHRRQKWGDEDLLSSLWQARLRITDCVGSIDNKPAVLLPETDREGARVVANDLQKIARDCDRNMDTEIFIFPDDDDVARKSSEYSQLTPVGDSQGQVSDRHASNENALNGYTRHSASMTRPAVLSTPATPVWKRLVDVFGASVGLLLLSPLFAIAAIAIRWSGPGPVFFRQQREGKDGVPFEILKFRTMCVDAESKKQQLKAFSEQDGPAFKIEADPRLTTVGKYLRKSCVDELPQLINVLRGDMSLVGPRPLPVDESTECSIWHRRRLTVAPGLTCIWQVQGNRDIKFDDWMRMDMEYIRRRSFLFDMKLIVATIFVAVLHRGSV